MLNLRKNNLLRNNSFTGKLLRLPLALIPRKLVVAILSGPLKGRKWIVGSHNHSAWLGIYERNQSLKFLQKCKGKKVFWDLGAHSGYYTLLFKSINRESTVYSFEPIKENYNYFLKHLDLNKLDKVILIKKAVSDQEGTLKFARGNAVGGKLSENGDMTVPVVRLSRLHSENIIETPDVIKMDVEDAEFRVLSDIKPLMVSEKRPIIFLSTHSKEVHDACLNFIQSLNYIVTPLDANTIELAREFLLEPNNP